MTTDNMPPLPYPIPKYTDIAYVYAYARAHAEQQTAELRSLLEAARDALYNPFEPDNQSRIYYRINEALK